MMSEKVSTQRELVSALADGQLRGKDFVRAVNLVIEDDDARATWQAYHLVGDVMRRGMVLEADHDGNPAAFLARFQTRLQKEALLPKAETVTVVQGAVVLDSTSNRQMSSMDGVPAVAHGAGANDASFRWKMLSGFASLAAVAAVGWGVFGYTTRPASDPQLAQISNLPPEQPQIMIRDPHLDALLAAHKQFGGTSALQMPSGFLRNATFEGPAR
jgi:sigma-E factor negative regulatory protein RseA